MDDRNRAFVALVLILAGELVLARLLILVVQS
jgi:hypothetical protein